MAEKDTTPKPPSINEIDLSKIKNLDAVEQVDKEFSKVVSKKTKSNKFNFAESELIPLPSRGILYKNVTEDTNILRGFIEMYPMTMKEEEILSTPRFLKTGSATRMIMDRCIASSIDAKDILLFDSNFLMFYLRMISYGDEYEFPITCSNAMCEKKFNHKIEISKLKFEELPEVKEPLKIELPVSKYTVECILPRLYHSEEIFMRDTKRKKSTSDQDRRLLDNLIVTTISIKDQNKKEVPTTDWEEFFEALPGKDTGALREATEFRTGVDELDGIECPYCGTQYEGTIPIGPEFFRF